MSSISILLIFLGRCTLREPEVDGCCAESRSNTVSLVCAVSSVAVLSAESMATGVPDVRARLRCLGTEASSTDISAIRVDATLAARLSDTPWLIILLSVSDC